MTAPLGTPAPKTTKGLASPEIRAIYERYGHLLLRRCRAIVRDEAGAEDALQEVFVNLMRYGAAFRDAKAKLAWLYRVADRCCFALLDRRRRAPVPTGEATPERIDASDDPSARHEVLSALGALDEDERTLAVLAFIEERDQGEIGRILGVSRQTINKRLKHLRVHAAALLQEES